MKLEIATRYTLVDANEKSNQIIPESYEKIIELPNNFFALIGNGFCKICDSDGNVLHLVNTRNVEKFLIYRKPNFICLNINQKWLFMQKDGKLSISSFDDINCEIGNDRLIGVVIDGKWGYADSNGKLCIPAEYEYCQFFSHIESLPVLVKKDGKFTFYSTVDDKIQFDSFDNATPFKFEPELNKIVAKVTLDKKQNLLLPNGTLFFDNFVDAFWIYEGLGIKTLKCDTSCYDWYTLKGNKIIEDCYSILPYKGLPLFIVEKEDGYGVTDEYGFFLTKCIYSQKMLLTEDMFILQKGGKFVLYKRDRGEIFAPETLCSKNCSDKDYLDYALKALNYYLS